MIALDTETTGVDFHHGARPFFVVTCDEEGEVRYWEWDVDPLTRKPLIPEGDVQDIGEYLFSGGPLDLVMQNAKFDVSALATIGMWDLYDVYEVWRDVKDTLVASHLLHSNQPKDLTSLAYRWLGEDIEHYETDLERYVKECRKKVQLEKQREKKGKGSRDFGRWRIAQDDDPLMPSAGEEPWRADYWLPRAYASYMWTSSEAGRVYENNGRDGEPHPEEMSRGLPGWEWRPAWVDGEEGVHEYWTVLRDYALQDAPATLACWRLMREEIASRGLMTIFRERMKVLPVSYRMEQEGVTVSGTRLTDLKEQYGRESADLGESCLKIAKSVKYPLVLPKGASPNNSLKEFLFEHLGLPVMGYTDTGNPSMDKNAISAWLLTLPQGSAGLRFLQSWQLKKKRDTSIAYMTGYERFWRETDEEGWYRLHPNLNVTGTDTLRFSSNHPNSQNISKQETICDDCEGDGCDECGMTGKSFRSLKYVFGPTPGREWYSFDARGIEDRLPAYRSGQQELIDIFERPDDPPYWGSNHYLRFHTIYPDIWDAELKHQMENPDHLKKKYKATYYQWCKNGGFAVQYGAVRRRGGTADKAFRKDGAHDLLAERFSKLEALNQSYIAHANKHGFVYTFEDRSLGMTHGYPLLCTRTNYGKVLETVPLNYVIQGSAMWWTMKAMIRVQEFFDRLNSGEEFAGRTWGGTYRIVLQVHDEIVCDMPRGRTREYNRPIVDEVMRLMSLGGDDYGIPTPVGCEYHTDNWAEGE